MCGIAGFSFEDKSLIKKMTDTIIHRGPDDSGYFTDKNISLGHRRLSVIDLSKRGRQPMSNEDGSIWITYNGEVYNYRELRGELQKKRHKFKSDTDTEVLIHSYEEFGIDFLKRLRGMFAFCIYDSTKNKVFLVRDRAGIKPLYYYHDRNQLVFASEIKAILETGIEKKINRDSLYSFVTFQYTIGNNTILDNVKKLLPGHYLELSDGSIKLTKYWELKLEPKEENEEYLIKEFRNIIDESVKMRLMSDVPFGAYLSGGIDSSSVVALMSKHVKEPVKTFSVGFGEKDDELKHARHVSEYLGTDHNEFFFDSSDLVKSFDKFIWHIDEPLADGGAIPTFLLSKKTKNKATVIMVGEGADENLAGYSWHMIRRPVPENMRLKIYYKMNTLAIEKYLNGYPGFRKFISEYKKIRSDEYLNRILGFEINNLLPNNLLMKVDRMTMSSAIEARVSYLDHKLIEFCGRLPINMKLNKSQGKYIQKKAMKGIVPDSIIKRKKHGFLVPIHRWLSQELGETARYYLLDEKFKIEGFENKDLSNLFKQNKINKIQKTNMIWRLLLYCKWYENFMH
jgi:asparagine synthase (glutamine-hydrolysing)